MEDTWTGHEVWGVFLRCQKLMVFFFFFGTSKALFFFFGKKKFSNVWTPLLKRCLWRYEGLANVFFHLTVSLMLQISPQCIEYQLISFPFWPHSRSHSPSVLFLFSPTTTSPVLLSLRSLTVPLCWLFFFFFSPTDSLIGNLAPVHLVP